MRNLTIPEDKLDIIDLAMIKELFKEHGQIPQGLRSLGIKGRRDSDSRFIMYGLDTIFKAKFEVLDIGCNCGFFSCLLAPYVHKVVGIDIDKVLVKIANLAARILNIRNALFIECDFKTLTQTFQYDLVIASQIHHWVGLPFSKYVRKLTALVKDGGYLLFESHDTDNVDADIDEKVSLMIDRGFTILHSGHWVEDPGQHWIPPKAHKKIPRQFYLMRYERIDKHDG